MHPAQLRNTSSFFILLACFFITACSKPYTTEDIRYNNGSVLISARIYKPEGAGKFPAVVIVPSAEPDTKETYRDYAEYFAAHGIVTICYDKRGAGNSGGNILRADFSDLMRDALAGIAYAKTLPFVDTASMGFLGHSQGGMYIFMADSISDDIAFLINISGSPSTPLKQSDYNIRSKVMENGGSQTYTDSLVALMDDYIAYLGIRANYISIKERHDKAIHDPQKAIADKIHYFDQFAYLKPPEMLPAYNALDLYPFIRSCNFEPGRFYPQLNIPALIIYGRQDHVIPAAQCIEKVTALKKENPKIDLKVYDKANHALKEESFSGQRYPDHYMEDLSNWIKMH